MEIFDTQSKRIELIFQEPITQVKPMSAFSDDFVLEKKSGPYLNKFEKGELKIRVLSPFISGWEEWDKAANKPIRYKEKPEDIPEDDINQFIAAIIWNYKFKKIQIFQTKKAGHIKAFIKWNNDPDWGSVLGYDVKLLKTGDGQSSRYDVAPLPKTPLDSAIEKAYKSKPINLEALFSGGDPFAEGQAAPVTFAAPVSSKITKEQAQELIELIGDDHEYRKEFEKRLQKAFDSSKFADIPSSQYTKIKDVLLEHNRKRLETELRKAG